MAHVSKHVMSCVLSSAVWLILLRLLYSELLWRLWSQDSLAILAEELGLTKLIQEALKVTLSSLSRDFFLNLTVKTPICSVATASVTSQHAVLF